jgi:hypothetical protein
VDGDRVGGSSDDLSDAYNIPSHPLDVRGCKSLQVTWN